MLRARCITTVSRMEFSDVMAGHAIDPYEEPADERGIADDEAGTDFGEQVERAAGAARVDDSAIDVNGLYAEDDDIEDAVLVDETSGGGEPEGDPQPPKQAPSAGDTDEWPPDLPPEAEPDDAPIVNQGWITRFAIACRNAGFSDDERHALIDQGTSGRVRSAKQVQVSEIPTIREWFDKLTAAEPDYEFRVLDDVVVIVPRSPEGTTGDQLPLQGRGAA